MSFHCLAAAGLILVLASCSPSAQEPAKSDDKKAADEDKKADAKKEVELLTKWRLQARLYQYAHKLEAGRCHQMSYWFGIPAVIFSTIVGTTVFATLQKEVKTWIKIVVGVISVMAAILSALQMYLGLGYSERAEKHHTAEANYTGLYMRLQTMAAFPPASNKELEDKIAKIEEDLEKLAHDSPRVPERIWNQARSYLQKSPDDGQ